MLNKDNSEIIDKMKKDIEKAIADGNIKYDFNNSNNEFMINAFKCWNALVSIESLEDNWDGQGAQAISKDAISKAITILLNLSDYKHYPTFITCTLNGDVQFEWENGPDYLEFEISANKETVNVLYVYIPEGDSTKIEEVHSNKFTLDELSDIIGKYYRKSLCKYLKSMKIANIIKDVKRGVYDGYEK